MKKRTLFVAPIVALAAANAQAQSSVTLYGVLDLGINYSTSAQTGRNADGSLKGSSQINMTDGAARGYTGSRWGLTGSEDLGDGLSAIFTLENGFSMANGSLAQGGLLFGRQLFVGLSSNRFGTVKLGRQYDTLADFVGGYSPGVIAGISGAAPGDVDSLGRTRRVNNAIKYQSQNYRGFAFGGMYSLGGQAGDFTRSQIWALGASYAIGGFSAGLGYFNARDPNLSSFGNNPNNGGPNTNNMGSAGSLTTAQSNPIYAGYSSAHTYEIYSAGTSYKYGRATFAATFSHSSFSHLGDLDAGPNPLQYRGTASFNTATGTVSYLAMPQLVFGGAYTYTHGGGAGGNGSVSYHQGVASVQYFFSKRTNLYFVGVYQVASGTDSLGQPAVASIELMTPSRSSHQFVGRVGIMQRF